MTEHRGFRNWRGWRRVVWVAGFALVLMTSVVLFFPNSLVNKQVAAGITSYLVEQLGPSAICGEIELGWRHITLRDILLPLGGSGSELTIPSLEVSIDPLVAISQPGAYERIVRTISVHDPRLTLVLEQGQGAKQAELRVPEEVFIALERVDSLRNVVIDRGRITILKEDSTLFTVSDVRGSLKNESGYIDLSIGAKTRGTVPSAIRFTGTIFPRERTFQVSGSVELNEVLIGLGGSQRDSLAITSGEINAEVSQSHDSLTLKCGVVAYGTEISLSGKSLYVPEARLELRNDVLKWSDIRIRGEGINVHSSGTVDLSDSLRLSGALNSEVSLPDALGGFVQFPPGTRGKFRVSGDLSGSLFSPFLDLAIRGDSITFASEPIDSLFGNALLSRTAITFDSVQVISQWGPIELGGVYSFFQSDSLHISGCFWPIDLPSLLGQQCGVRQVEFAVDGTAAKLETGLVVRDSTGELLGSASVFEFDKTWNFVFHNPDGDNGLIRFGQREGAWKLSASNAHSLVPIAFPGMKSALETIRQFEFNFEGDRNSGKSDLVIQTDAEKNEGLTRILRNLEFDGNYERNVADQLGFTGNWYGISGDGEEFFGQGKVQVAGERITIESIYIDEAGALSGTIDVDSSQVDLRMSVDELPLSRMPWIAPAAEKWRLSGDLSGEISVAGNVDSLEWYADVSLVNGIAQGVPGYWGLLTADGKKARADQLYLSFGRGVRSIFEATGSVDAGSNSVDLRVNFPASDCADFIQALAGKTGILSGDLDGEVLIFGDLTRPDVVASVRVEAGELLGELAVDRFAIDATLGTEIDGRRLLAIPQLSFYKEGEYSFSGELSAEPVEGGRFKAYLGGEGDFLDMLQQVDADFTSNGSQSKLHVEVGGTWNNPRFEGGELTIQKGAFTYPPAAPGELVMTTYISLNSSGVVDSGLIRVDEGSDYLQIELLDSSDDRVIERDPLIIPKPRIELGVLLISTSPDGINVRLPGFMKPEWLGRLRTLSADESGISISQLGDSRLSIAGDVQIEDARFTFPFISYGGNRMRPVTKWLVDRLYEAEWDLSITMGNGSHYDVEITGFKDSELFTQIGRNAFLGTVAEYLDHISVDALVSPTESPLVMVGSLQDSSLRISGRLTSTSGKADYLDQTFWIEELQADFDETDIFPVISGRAATYGLDSVGRTLPVFLTIYEIDEETGTRIPYGRFEDVTYVLEADGYPAQEQVLGLLGYDVTEFSQGKAEQLLTRTAMTAAKRLWLDPISRKLERATFLDEISLAPGGGASASVFRQQRNEVLVDTLEATGVIRLLKGSNVTVGKYVTKDVFVTYTGELAEAAGEIEGGRLGLIHYWNLQYRVIPVSPDFVLDFAVEYDEASRQRDESVALKYSFVLEP